MSDSTSQSQAGQSDTRPPRCLCGHYATEHGPAEFPVLLGHCHGAYATLMADPDDYESVEVHCHCDHFFAVEANYHEVRS